MDKMDGMTMNIEQANVGKLKEVFPEVFADGKIDFDKLQGLLGHYIADDKEKYSFSWKGKADSMRLAQKRSTGTLRPCKEESKDWDTTENLYIEGDNLEVLKLLQSSYLNSVKMIYIDPPYNTGNDFVYTDDFADGIARYKEVTGQATKSNPETAGRYHTNWLNMMYPRLKLARNLLTDDGVIFISIDDNEQANLKKLCDEVFGEDNFVASMIWQQRKGGGNDSKYIAKDHEYIQVYAKNISNLPDNWRIEQSEEYLKRYKECDENGKKYYWDTLVRNGLQNPIIITIQTPDSKEITINSQWSKERVLEGLKNGTVRFTKTSNGWSLHHKVYMGGGQVLRSILMDCGNNRSAVVELTELFGELYFDYPKPSQLVKIFAKLCTNKDSIILDFFSGSATTAHAVMQLNAEDGGKRKFICVQLPEKTDEQSEAYKAGYKTICEIGKERIRRAGEKILKESGDIRVESGDDDRNSTLNSQNSTLDIGFKVFKLDSSNLVKWDNTPTTDEEEVKKRIQQSLFYLVEGREDLDLSVEWNDTAIISSIVGVVGTILGTVIGFLLSVLSRSGRQNVICKGIELSYYYGVNDIGDRVYRKESNFDGKVPERTKLSLELLITNSSEMPFNMNLVKLIIKKGEEIFHGNLLDKNINKGSNSIIIHENINTKQIGGKNSIYLELYTQFNEVYVYKETDSFYIEYIDVKGRTIHKKIKMGGIHETEI